MKLTVIGCSGSYPGPDSAASCYLLEAPDPDDPGRTWRVVVDLGSGSLGPLQKYVDPLTVDGIFISHLHADHFFDISGYYVLRKYHPSGSQPRIPLWGPRGTKSRIARAYGLPLDPGMNEEFRFRKVRRSKPMTVGPFSVVAKRMDHPIEAYAFRIECGGRVLVYSGDTAKNDDLVELARGADVLLAEAAFRDDADNPPGIHMTGSEAATVAQDARAGMLVLTHIPPWHVKQDAVEEAKGHFDGTIELAAEGAVYEV